MSMNEQAALGSDGPGAPRQPGRTAATRPPWGLWAAVGAICLFFGAPALMHPFGYDQANQAYIAMRVLEGDALYRDVSCLKPPLPVYFHAAAIALFGRTMVAVRVLDLVWVFLTALTLAAFVRRSLGEQWSTPPLFVAFFYCHYYYSFNFWHSAQTDGWLNLPVAIGMLLVISLVNDQDGARPWTLLRWGLVGLMGWAALMFKYSALPFVLLWFPAVLLSPPGRRGLGFLGLSSGLAVGAAATAVVLVITGSLHAFLYEHLLFVQEYGSKSGAFTAASSLEAPHGGLFGRLTNLPALYEIFARAPGTFLFALLGVAAALFALSSGRGRRETRVWFLALAGWGAAAWACTAVQGRFYGYHFLPSFAPWAILAGLAVGVSVDALPWKSRRAAIRTGAAGLLVALTLLTGDEAVHQVFRPIVRAQVKNLSALLTGRMTLEEHWANRDLHDITRNFRVSETLAVARYIRQTTSPQQSMFIWGSNMAVAFLADRPRVSKIDTSYQVFGVGGIPGGGDPTTRLLEDFRRRPPALIVVQLGDAIPHILGHDKDSYRMLLENDRMLKHLSENYSRTTVVERFMILLRNQ